MNHSVEEDVKEIVQKLLAPGKNKEREDLASWYKLYIIMLSFCLEPNATP